MNYFRGFVSALVGAVTFGLIPLFALPVLAAGMTFYNLLFYRLIFAAASLACFIAVTKKSFKIEPHFVLPIAFLSLANTLCSFFFIWGYDYISSGLATSLHFLYPVFVSVAMICFFGEKKSFSIGLSIFMAIVGVGLLSAGDENISVSLAGIGIILFSSVWYAVYLVGTNKSSAAQMDGLVYTFYVMLFGAFYCLSYAIAVDNFQPIPADFSIIWHLSALGIIATLLPNVALVDAIHRIGSTMTAVLGALEPLTAVAVGVWVFHEPFSQRIGFAVGCILGSVLVLIISKNFTLIYEKILCKIGPFISQYLVDIKKEFGISQMPEDKR
ncbi:MAG: DMT family transporter [Alphaproteobacteria bacterium]